MKITALKCLVCGSIVYSRARHDFHWCPCKSVAIDGGQVDYIKVNGNFEDYEMITIEVDVTLKELYNDWNKEINKYGLIEFEWGNKDANTRKK